MNRFEGFGDWLKTLNVDPKYAGDQDIVVSDIVLTPANGGAPVQYRGVAHFKIVKVDPNQRWAILKDLSYPDNHNKDLAAFPHAFAPSDHAGQQFLVQGDQFDKLIAPRISATSGTGTPPGGPTGGLPGGPK